MLTLTRKAGESIAIGDDVVVTIVYARGGKACVSISAPRVIEIDRMEIRERKLAARKGAQQ